MDGTNLSGLNRRRLPSRREHRTEKMEWNSHERLIAVGFDDRGIGSEVFSDREKTLGSDTDRLLNDACILISMLAQHGYSFAGLLAKLMRTEGAAAEKAFHEATGESKPSLIAALIAKAADIEARHGPEIAETHRLIAAAKEGA